MSVHSTNRVFAWTGLNFLKKDPVWFLVIFKSVYMLLALAVVLLFPTNCSSPIFHSKRQAWTADGHLTLESHFTAWDSEHYLHISEAGYDERSGVCAFYPLWPMMVRWFSSLTGGNHVIGGMILANLVSLVGFCLFFRLVKRRRGEYVAWVSLFFLLAFPGSLFFHFNYTEGLFLMLAMLLCTGLEEDRRGLALLAGFLLPLTRAVGFLCVAPILLYVLIYNENVRALLIKLTAKPGWPGWAQRTLRCFLSEPPETPGLNSNVPHPRWVATPFALWLVLAPICGWIFYFILMWKWTGNPFEGFVAQNNWGVQSVENLFNIPKFIIGFLSPTTWHEFNGSVLDRLVFVFCMMLLPRIWRMDKTWFLWTVMLGIVPAVSGTFVSYTRFASVVFPVFVALGTFLQKPERSIIRVLTIYVFSLLQLWLLWRFINYSWAG